jgi:hypothetical protein
MWQEERTSTARLPSGKAIVSNNTNQIRKLKPNFCIKTRATISQKFSVTIRVPLLLGDVSAYRCVSSMREIAHD